LATDWKELRYLSRSSRRIKFFFQLSNAFCLWICHILNVWSPKQQKLQIDDKLTKRKEEKNRCIMTAPNVSLFQKLKNVIWKTNFIWSTSWQ
jgi:hypothetical protein